jgi:hypothetical protein
VYFLQFSVSKIRVSPTHVISSLFPPRCRFYSVRRRHTVTPCHASFSCSQDEFAPSTSSSVNTSSRRLPSQAEIKVLNSYHRHSPTLILNCYKKVTSTLSTLSTTQPHLYFTSSLARAPHHRSSTRRCYFSPSSHIYRPSAQRNDELPDHISLTE